MSRGVPSLNRGHPGQDPIPTPARAAVPSPSLPGLCPLTGFCCLSNLPTTGASSN